MRTTKVTMNSPTYFEMQADDPSRGVRFYEELFGWKFTPVEGLPIQYWRIETDGPRGGLLKRPGNPPPPAHGTNAFVCSMEVEDFDGTAQKITNRGGIVAMPKFAVPGTCWQGYFLENEGNTFRIFQVDANAR